MARAHSLPEPIVLIIEVVGRVRWVVLAEQKFSGSQWSGRRRLAHLSWAVSGFCFPVYSGNGFVCSGVYSSGGVLFRQVPLRQ